MVKNVVNILIRYVSSILFLFTEFFIYVILITHSLYYYKIFGLQIKTSSHSQYMRFVPTRGQTIIELSGACAVEFFVPTSLKRIHQTQTIR